MKLLLVRHAPAEDRADYAPKGIDDGLRPLTDAGREKMRRAAAGLKRAVPRIDTLASSPLTRALQTAEIVSAAYGGLAIDQVDKLSPSHRPDELFPWLSGFSEGAVVAAVGHEPALGELAGSLLAGASSFMVFKKGGVCMLDVPRKASPGCATLEWALAPRHLRALG